jgi:thiosulfate/3-mercaptopyruvate sulfurtransferase
VTAPLIDVTALAARLDDPLPPVLLDVRWSLAGGPGRADYAAGHLPGARFVDLDTDLADPPGPRGRHPLPDADRFAAAMRRLGVRADTGVVVYDAADSTAAARAWWLLRRFGHPDVRVLDGGLAAWLRADGLVEAHPPVVTEGDFTPGPSTVDALALDAVLPFAADGLLLDARAAERYRGEVEPVDPVAGHIPGAVSAPTAANVTGDGTFADPAALRDRFVALGADGTRPVAVYCGSGVTAAHEVLALEVAGVRAALYPGSWSEWVADPARPVATAR